MIHQETITYIAKLSRLSFTENESQTYAEYLQQILDYVAKLSELDISNVEPSLHTFALSNVFREDQVRHLLSEDQIFANAVETEFPYFKVPRMMGEKEC